MTLNTTPAPGPPLNCWLAPGYEPLKMLAELVQQVRGLGGHIEQSFLYLDPMSAACWCRVAQQEDYASAQEAMPVERAALHIARCAAGRDLEVLGLGCGDGKNEVRLVQHLLTLRQPTRLYLLDISQPLLSVAYRHAVEVLGEQEGALFSAVQGNFHHLPRYTELLASGPPATRVICLFGGTFANLDDEILFIRRSLGRCVPGDLLLLNTSLVAAPADHIDEILARDPRLCGALPAGWQQRYEEWLSGPLRRYGDPGWHIRYATRLDRTCCPVPGSYAIEVRASVDAGGAHPRDFSLFRVKRYEVSQLAACLRGLGWSPVDGWRYGQEPAGRLLYLFRRQG